MYFFLKLMERNYIKVPGGRKLRDCHGWERDLQLEAVRVGWGWVVSREDNLWVHETMSIREQDPIMALEISIITVN